MTAKAELWRGSTVDTTNVTYKWAIMDASVTSSSSTGYDADFGTGWRKLSNALIPFEDEYVDGINVYPDNITLVVGAEQELNAEVYPSTAVNKTVYWTSSDETVPQDTGTDGYHFPHHRV